MLALALILTLTLTLTLLKPGMPRFVQPSPGFSPESIKRLTCSAFTTGLMTIGLKLGEIEDSFPRVVRMLAIMIAGGNAFADHLNKFNRLMNLGNKMSKWFKKEFGSTLCHDITQCDFSSLENVHRYIEKDSVSTCKILAEKVAAQAKMIIKQKGNF